MRFKPSNLPLIVNITSFIIPVLILVFVIITLIVGTKVDHAILELQEEALSGQVDDLAEIFNQFINTSEEFVELTAKNSLVAKSLKSKEYSTLQTFVDNINGIHGYYENVFFTDANGTIINSVNGAANGVDIRPFPFWESIVKQKNSIHIDQYPYTSPVSGHPVIVIAKGILDDNGKVLGLFCTPIDLTKYGAKNITNRTYANTGYPYIATDQSMLTIHPNEDILMNTYPDAEWSKKMIGSKKDHGFFEYDYNGRDKVQAFSKMEKLPWYVAATVYTEELTVASAEIRNIVIVLAVIAVIIVSIILIFGFNTFITKRLNTFLEKFKLGSNGDLTVTVDDDAKDEIGQLAQNFNKFIKDINEIISKISTNTGTIASSSEELSAVSSQMLSGAEEMTSQATGVASATEEMGTNISTMASAAEEMSVNANEVAGAAEQTSQNMNAVSSAVEEMSVSIGQIAKDASTASEVADKATESSKNASIKMGTLSEAAKEIGNVTEVIKRIAEQTNLLALNATIEAASAGEAGKGFAVVANEIKELANQSAKAADDIATRIDGVQSNTEEAVTVISGVSEIIDEIGITVNSISKAVDQQSNAVNDISANVSQAGSGVENIAASIAEVAKGANDVSRNSGEASKGASEVTSNINSIQSVAQETTTGAGQVSSSANDLAEMSSNLKAIVGQFKL
jgi:methyl-accepting chemotaxis protein